ncbi:MAG: hypothetical protein EA349_08275 [Halomonadaceae bacterium]|nr:MAG: hypothetical protein EA349_08275 [Halomonadaceae bacterium]
MGRALLGLLFLLLLAGCRTERDPENPTILGSPPQDAYLGVDYYYNFGALGGDDLLNYSLSNAPQWMTLEDTTNKARKGVVLRGVPGISGGRRGEADLGTTDNIRITSNDGKLIGDGSFSVRVQHNPLTVKNAQVEEGKAYIPNVNQRDDNVCELPDMKEVEDVEVSHRKLAVVNGADEGLPEPGPGGFNPEVSRTYEAYPILIEVTLGQPSVEPVTVKFEVRDNFDSDFDGTDGFGECSDARADEENIPCEYRNRNQGKAIYNEDFKLNSGRFSAPPDYLEYLSEEDRRGTGLLTFEPGITRCFIRAEVFADNLPESTESFTVELLEVRQGIASLSENGAVRRATVNILDNTPILSLSPEVITQSRGQTRQYTARLSEPNPHKVPMQALLDFDPTESDATTADYVLSFADQEGSSVVLSFPPDEDEVHFGLELLENGSNNEPRQLDDLLRIRGNVAHQFGREFFARSQGAESDVSINEWTTPLSITEFVPSSIVSGAFGELYLAGLGNNATTLNLWSINRLGVSDVTAEDTERLLDQVSLEGLNGSPRLAFNTQQRGTSNIPRLRRNLALGFGTDGSFADSPGTGIADFGLMYFRSLIGRESNDDEVEEPFPDMVELWRTRDGSAAADMIEQLLVQSNGRVVVGGITEGDWEDPNTGTLLRHQGNGDILQVAYDTLQEDTNSFRSDRLWASVEGSGQRDRFAGIGESLRGEIMMLGSSQGEFRSGQTVGGEDFIYSSINPNGFLGRTLQFGTNEHDRFEKMVMAPRHIWGVGSSSLDYRLDADERTPRLLRSPGFNNSHNPYVLVTNQLGNLSAVMVAPSADSAANQTVSAVASSGSRLYISGETDGAFVPGEHGPGAYLLMVSYNERARLDEDEEFLKEEWRIQLPGVERVLDLSLHDNRKLFMLVDEGNNDYQVRIYNQLGELLTE